LTCKAMEMEFGGYAVPMADGGYVASITLLIPGGDGRPAAPDADSGKVLGPKEATAGWD
jgi:hypothetical protein